MSAQSIFRGIMRRWIRAALWFRYREVRIVFHSPLPLDEGAILAGNHQNAMLDSITLAACSPKVPFTLSRGSLFQGRVSRWLLATLRMVPIYRFRDGFRRMRENPDVFRGFVELLKNNHWISIFPEGSHYLRYTLRPFQKGIARIVFAAQNDQDWAEDIPIFPVGLQYESHTTFGSRLLIQYGPPVSSLAFRELYSEHPKKAERALTAHLFQEMQRLLILPPSEDEAYDAALRRWGQNQSRFPDLMEQFRSDRRLMAEEHDSTEPDSEVEQTKTVAGGSADAGKTGAFKRMAGYILSAPGVLLHLPVILLTLTLGRILLEDPHIVPAWRFVVGVFLVPIWYLSASGVGLSLGLSLPSTLLLLASMPLSLWLWSRSWHLTR